MGKLKSAHRECQFDWILRDGVNRVQDGYIVLPGEFAFTLKRYQELLALGNPEIRWTVKDDVKRCVHWMNRTNEINDILEACNFISSKLPRSKRTRIKKDFTHMRNFTNEFYHGETRLSCDALTKAADAFESSSDCKEVWRQFVVAFQNSARALRTRYQKQSGYRAEKEHALVLDSVSSEEFFQEIVCCFSYSLRYPDEAAEFYETAYDSTFRDALCSMNKNPNLVRRPLAYIKENVRRFFAQSEAFGFGKWTVIPVSIPLGQTKETPGESTGKQFLDRVGTAVRANDRFIASNWY